MLERLRAWIEAEGAHPDGRDALQMAVAALLVEAAGVDEKLDERERAVIDRLLERRFGLAARDADGLEQAAEERVARSAQLFGYVSTINQRLPLERRIELVEMLWEVAYADGVLTGDEDTLIRRVAGLIDVSDRDRGDAKLRVRERLEGNPPR